MGVLWTIVGIIAVVGLVITGVGERVFQCQTRREKQKCPKRDGKCVTRRLLIRVTGRKPRRGEGLDDLRSKCVTSTGVAVGAKKMCHYQLGDWALGWRRRFADQLKPPPRQARVMAVRM